ncbi:MAG: helix-turn-helix transcriptional regulator [Lachnospiraceae bacterium]|nr:helix-turn-helix transcriptional regulator [Lachnospiraceae bacterium]
MMTDKATLQSYDRSKVERSRLLSLDLETLDGPTYPLLHQEARFLYVLRGSGVIELQGKPLELRPGALLGMLPWQVSNVTVVSEPLQFYTVIYNLQVFSEFFALFPEKDGKPLDFVRQILSDPVFYCSPVQTAWMQDYFLRLQNEVGLESILEERPPKVLSSLGAMTQLLTLVIQLMRFKAQAGQAEEGAAPEKRRDLRDVLRYMYAHTAEKLSVEGLARTFYVSESALRSYIREMTGMGFYDLLNEMRLGKVSGYLLYTNMTLEEISEAVGFWDASHISKVFSEYAGMPIHEYRRSYQQPDTLPRLEEARTGYAVSEYLTKHYAEELSPKQVAERFGLSVSEMNRLLLIQTSRNYEDFLNYVRVSRAGRLLLETKLTVTDIAAEVGYGSVKTLNRNFFRINRTTPTNFRASVVLQPKR